VLLVRAVARNRNRQIDVSEFCLSELRGCAEELEAEQEAVRLHDEMETTRLSQRSLAGSNYETRRASDPDNY